MKVNVAGIRFIADAIEMNDKMYDQYNFGSVWKEPELAGTGLQCNTPCCVAGFTVLLLGDEKGLKEEQDRVILTKPSLYRKNLYKVGLSNYAKSLLGITVEWSKSIFDCATWPAIWADEDSTIKLVTERNYDCDFIYPTAEQAAFFLRRLADQFEEEQGSNVNTESVHKIFTHTPELVEVE